MKLKELLMESKAIDSLILRKYIITNKLSKSIII